MAIKEDVQKRAPRGTNIVTKAFFAALDDIADGQQAVVGTAALAAIRNQLKERRAKNKGVAAAAKAKTPAKRKVPARATAVVKVAAKARTAPVARRAASTKRPPTAQAGKQAAGKTPAKKAVAGKTRQPKQTDKAVSPSAETATE
jgi:DNA transposition AAA+ family ATPase